MQAEAEAHDASKEAHKDAAGDHKDGAGKPQPPSPPLKWLSVKIELQTWSSTQDRKFVFQLKSVLS